MEVIKDSATNPLVKTQYTPNFIVLDCVATRCLNLEAAIKSLGQSATFFLSPQEVLDQPEKNIAALLIANGRITDEQLLELAKDYDGAFIVYYDPNASCERIAEEIISYVNPFIKCSGNPESFEVVMKHGRFQGDYNRRIGYRQ